MSVWSQQTGIRAVEFHQLWQASIKWNYGATKEIEQFSLETVGTCLSCVLWLLIGSWVSFLILRSFLKTGKDNEMMMRCVTINKYSKSINAISVRVQISLGSHPQNQNPMNTLVSFSLLYSSKLYKGVFCLFYFHLYSNLTGFPDHEKDHGPKGMGNYGEMSNVLWRP